MAQNASKWHQRCRKCRASIDQPCLNNQGREAGQVHWGRGEYVERNYNRTGFNRSSPQRTVSQYARPAPTPERLDAVAEYEARRYGD